MKHIFSLLGGALGIAFFVAFAWFVLFHVKVLQSGYAVVVYEEGDLLHRILSLFI